jgi:hypothetical protein
MARLSKPHIAGGLMFRMFAEGAHKSALIFGYIGWEGS